MADMADMADMAEGETRGGEASSSEHASAGRIQVRMLAHACSHQPPRHSKPITTPKSMLAGVGAVAMQ
jgi:hypothetical protein